MHHGRSQLQLTRGHVIGRSLRCRNPFAAECFQAVAGRQFDATLSSVNVPFLNNATDQILNSQIRAQIHRLLGGGGGRFVKLGLERNFRTRRASAAAQAHPATIILSIAKLADTHSASRRCNPDSLAIGFSRRASASKATAAFASRAGHQGDDFVSTGQTGNRQLRGRRTAGRATSAGHHVAGGTAGRRNRKEGQRILRAGSPKRRNGWRTGRAHFPVRIPHPH